MTDWDADPLVFSLARRYFPPRADGEDWPSFGTAGMFSPRDAADGRGATAAMADWLAWRNAQGWDIDPENLALGFAGPLRAGGLETARDILGRVARGEKPPAAVIGDLTAKQFSDMNAIRQARGMPPLSSPDVRYNGRHHYASRSKDGDNVDEMLTQIERSMDPASKIENQPRGPALVNPTPRVNPRGETVQDQAVINHRQQGGADLFSAYGKVKRSPTPQGVPGSTPASGSPEPITRTPPASGHSGPVKTGTPGSKTILPLLPPAASAEPEAMNGDIRELLLQALQQQGAHQ